MKAIIVLSILICMVALSQQVNATNCSTIFKANGCIVLTQVNQTNASLEIDNYPPRVDPINRVYIHEDEHFIDTFNFVDKESEGYVIVEDIDFIEKGVKYKKYKNKFEN